MEGSFFRPPPTTPVQTEVEEEKEAVRSRTEERTIAIQPPSHVDTQNIYIQSGCGATCGKFVQVFGRQSSYILRERRIRKYIKIFVPMSVGA